MNHITLIGRLTKDPDLRYTKDGKPVCNFTLAVNRPHSNDETDFINCVVWGKAAENVAKYVSKGRQLAVEGRLQIRSYDGNDGQRKYVTEVVCERTEFLGGYGGQKKQQPKQQDFGTEVSFSDDDLPF